MLPLYSLLGCLEPEKGGTAPNLYKGQIRGAGANIQCRSPTDEMRHEHPRPIKKNNSKDFIMDQDFKVLFTLSYVPK